MEHQVIIARFAGNINVVTRKHAVQCRDNGYDDAINSNNNNKSATSPIPAPSLAQQLRFIAPPSDEEEVKRKVDAMILQMRDQIVKKLSTKHDAEVEAMKSEFEQRFQEQESKFAAERKLLETAIMDLKANNDRDRELFSEELVTLRSELDVINRKHKSSIEELEQTIASLRGNNEKLSTANQALEAHIRQLESDLAERKKKQCQQLQEQQQQLQQHQKQESINANTSSSEEFEEIQKLRADLDREQQSRKALEGERSSLLAKISQIEQSAATGADQLRSENAQLKASLERHVTEIAQINEQLEAAQQEIARLKKELKDAATTTTTTTTTSSAAAITTTTTTSIEGEQLTAVLEEASSCSQPQQEQEQEQEETNSSSDSSPTDQSQQAQPQPQPQQQPKKQGNSNSNNNNNNIKIKKKKGGKK